MRIAVTGGRGRMGRALIELALRRGHEVVSIDNRPPSPEDQRDPRLLQLTVDVTIYEDLEKAVAGADGLIHLAAFPSPFGHPAHQIHNVNVTANYNALCAAVASNIEHICLASSINATGAAFSREVRYDYFPLDEEHPTYNEDPYSLSKWVGEAAGDSIARRYANLTIASMRFHRLVPSRDTVLGKLDATHSSKDLWAYTNFEAAARACLAVLDVSWKGHEAFYIVAPRTAMREPTAELCKRFFPTVPLREELTGTQGLYSGTKAKSLLGWVHDDPDEEER